jgi:tetratricopeptide (TPR) repeat protein
MVRLVESGLVIEKNVASDAIYTFKHALVQEAAYGSLLKSRRRELHRAAATTLNENFPEVAQVRPELVAQHLTQAGDTEPAVEAWQAAGERAAKRAALTEAMRHFNKALDLLYTLPESDERDHMELPIQLTLGDVTSALKGFGSQEKHKIFARARQICEKLGSSTQFLIVMLGLWGTANSRSEIIASREISNEFLRLAEKDGSSMMLAWAHESQAIEAYAQGSFATVGKHFALMQKYYKKDEQTWAPFDPFVLNCIHASLSLWHLGFADQARELIRKQYAHAQDLSPTNLAMAHLGACSLYINVCEPETVLKNADAMSKIGAEQQLPAYQAWAKLYRGIAWIQQGEYEKGVAALTTAVGEYLATGTHSALGEYLGYLAEGYAGMGDVEKASSVIKDAFGATPEEKMNLPKLHCTHADILWKQPNANLKLVEATYRQAIEVSRQIASPAWELQVVTRLGRLLQSCGRGTEALALITPLYAKFTEGFDTKTLQDAKELMQELA